MKCRNGNGIFSRAFFFLLFLAGLSYGASAQASEEEPQPSAPPESSMSESSLSPTSSWDNIDSLLNDLIAESEASVQDWIALSVKLGALQTEASGLSGLLAESKTQFENSEKSRKSEREAAAILLEAAQNKAIALEKKVAIMRVVLEVGLPVAAILGALGGVWLMPK